jgi:outer membrane protein
LIVISAPAGELIPKRVATTAASPSDRPAGIEGQEEEAEAHLHGLDAREESLKQQVALEIRTAWYSLKNAIDSLPVLHIQTEYARNAARLADERYRERLGSFVELSTAQASLAEASASESVGLYDAMIADSELRRATGRR